MSFTWSKSLKSCIADPGCNNQSGGCRLEATNLMLSNTRDSCHTPGIKKAISWLIQYRDDGQRSQAKQEMRNKQRAEDEPDMHGELDTFLSSKDCHTYAYVPS